MSDIFEKHLRLEIDSALLDTAWVIIGRAHKDRPSDFTGDLIGKLDVLRRDVQERRAQAFAEIAKIASDNWKEAS